MLSASSRTPVQHFELDFSGGGAWESNPPSTRKLAEHPFWGRSLLLPGPHLLQPPSRYRARRFGLRLVDAAGLTVHARDRRFVERSCSVSRGASPRTHRERVDTA